MFKRGHGTIQRTLISLLDIPDLKARKLAILKLRHNFDRVATYLAVFDVSLLVDGGVHQHADFLPAIWALEKVFEHIRVF